MKNLKDIIESHNFLVNKKLKNRQKEYEYFPKTKEELQDIIINLLEQSITDLNCINTSKITDMSKLFYLVNKNVTVLKINISEWNVSNVTDMNSMFENCENFNADLSDWDVSNVTDMSRMFRNCYKFNSDLSKWDVSNVKNMFSMFDGCKEFNADLSKWNVSNVTEMSYMFWECKKFNSDLSNWDISNVKDKKAMFISCKSLTKEPKWYEL